MTCPSGFRSRLWPKIQVALEHGVAEVTKLEGYELKRIMRTGTVASVDNRNWELRDQSGPVQRLSQSRAIALDMESATIAANGYRFRVPYGTLLCVSDKPLHGELKLARHGLVLLYNAGQPPSGDRNTGDGTPCAACRWSVCTAGNCVLSTKRPSSDAKKQRNPHIFRGFSATIRCVRPQYPVTVTR